MTRTRSRRTVQAIAIPLVGLAGLLAATSAEPAQAEAKAKAPQLSITVDDGRTDAGAADSLRYTVTITNLGADRVRDLHLSQTVPAGSSFDSADHGGRVRKGTIGWTVDLGAGRTTTVTSSLAVDRDLPPELLRLATVACASTSATAAPVVCASDSDLLPAGASAEVQQRQLDEAGVGAARPAWVLPAGLGSGALLLVAALVLGGRAVGRRRVGLGGGSSPQS
jgi:uncharacterized repeat protein (TIGR01451 family)